MDGTADSSGSESVSRQRSPREQTFERRRVRNGIRGADEFCYARFIRGWAAFILW